MEKDIMREMIDLFKPTQTTAATHQKNSILLKRLYENSEPEAFFSVFKKMLNVILSIDKGNKYVEKTIDFIALFCSMLKSKQIEPNDDTVDYVEHPLLSEIFAYLLETSKLHKDIIRFRSCELINKILDQLVGSEVSSDLCEKLEETLLIRLQDPKNVIRQQAVIALHRLQDPHNPQDAIIQQLLHLMNSDSFAKVRLLCIENIAARKDVVNNLIIRIRDVDVNVRLAAYKRLSNFAEYLKISEKRRILHCGFLDSSVKIREYVCTTVIKCWLDHYKGSIFSLMKSVRLDADERDIEKTVTLFEHILSAFFKNKSLTDLSAVLMINKKKLVSLEYLNWEVASYWRIYVQFLNTNDGFEDELDKVLPELVYFCTYIKEYYTHARKEVTTVEFLEQQFILKQLFLIIKTYDFADVANRQCLNSLVYNILEKIVLMSDVTEVVLSQMRVKLNCLLEEQNEAVKQENYMEAERLKHDIEQVNNELRNLKNLQTVPQQQIQKKTDIPTIIKYLDIAAGLLLSPKVTHLTSSLKTLKDDVIQELLIHDNDNVRVKALRCYALCCIVDKHCASNGIHIFSTPIFAYQNGEECDTQTLLICIGAVVDLLRIYGPKLMAASEKEVLSESVDETHERVFAGGTSLTDLIQGLVDLMDDEQYEIQEKAAWGLCQLVLSDRIHSPSLISRLVLKWCSPASDNGESERLTQFIGFTLERVPSVSDSSEQLEEAVLMTVKALALAPKISPLADVNIENISKFMIALCKTSHEGAHIHTNLAQTICCEIKDKPRNRINLILSKMLLLLDIPNDKIIVRDLLKICDQIKDDVNDRLVLNNVVKFVSSLSNMDHTEFFAIEEENEEGSRNM
ncbi:hypothetical protein NQ314_001614 [Rhamnusium bicolor]|uniref:Nuclear condensin complex subunit 3 C-terminal domain-containing protein n=1 Tax=Rhamnusium bicolor TaxID=1586634 RepID=A0AAV8ZTS9_9CUCU|nr:hypothetical protein NQ314_001614 [Rhamnusium bicolor]